jgi:HK97 family phage major capsid protein
MYPITDPQERRAREVLALGEQLAAHGGRALALRTLREGGDAQAFMRRLRENLRDGDLSVAADRVLGLDRRDVEGFSISRALKAAITNPHNLMHEAPLEAEISNLAATRTRSVPFGFWVPYSQLTRNFDAGGATEAGKLITSAVEAAYMQAPLRKGMPLERLGATVLTGTDTIVVPTFAQSTAAAWKTEIGAATSIVETTTAATLTPKRVPVTMAFSRQALLQSSQAALDATIGRHLTDAIWELITDAALSGDGTSESPVGITSTTGVGSVVGGTNGATLTFLHLADLEKAPRTSNVPDSAQSGFVVNSVTARYLRTLQPATGQPYVWAGGARPLLSHRAEVSNVLPANIVKGSSGANCSRLVYANDWSHLLIALYGGGVDVVVDRITLADAGQIRVVATAIVGIGVTRPQAFAVMSDALLA